MRRIAAASILLLLCVPLMAAEPNPSPRHRQLILELLELTGSTRMGPAIMDAFFTQIEQQVLQEAEAEGNSPEDIAEAKELFASFRQHAARIDFMGVLTDELVRLYARYFTEAEIEGLIEFYRTPLGAKTIQVLPQLMNESMALGAQALGPKIDAAMAEAMEETERRRPWRQTMRDLTSVAVALEAWSIDHDEQYPTGDFAALKDLLVPEYMRELPEKDIWGNAYAYVVSPDHLHYRLVSAGAGGIFEWDSRTIPSGAGESTELRYKDRLEDDIIYQDGMFLQLPVQAKPKEQ